MRPFLKWAGGKSALVDQITKLIPENFGTYYEPFVGGGAVFFNMQSTHSVINDKNIELINCYLQVRDHCEDLMPILDEMQKNHSEENYYSLRSVFNLRKASGNLEVYDAALMIYLNKTGFNGMYRENSSGNFNIPSGKRKNVKLYERENLLLASERLKHAEILSGDFEDALWNVREGDFVYFDSPYDETFSDYQKGGFPKEDHERLCRLCEKLTEKNVYFLLSSSDSAFIRDLYKDYEIREISVQRMIGFKRDRKKETELLIKNY